MVVLAALGTPTRARAQVVKSSLVASGLDQPVGVRASEGDHERLYVIERSGRIRIIRNGVLLPRPFLDLSSEVQTFGEAGLLGLDYRTNGRFFVTLVDTSSTDPQVREYHVSPNRDRADPASGMLLFGPYPHQFDVHYSGDLQFGADGMLYCSLGDGGPDDPQAVTGYHGKMLRFDVDAPAPHVPVDNPFAAPNDGAEDWIWAIGLRNAWRFSFDRLTGDLYIGDVGQDLREELDFQPASFGMPGAATYQGGRNYGWRCMEGTLCTTATYDCACDTSGATLVLPVLDLQHGPAARVIIGGYVYRGSAIAGLGGTYVFGDWSTNRFASLVVSNGQATQLTDRTPELLAGPAPHPQSVTSFGADANGELYFTSFYSGLVFRIDPVGPACPAPLAYCATSPNSAGSGARIGSTGSASLGAAELVLTASRGPRNVAGIFFHGSQPAQVPFANGTRCVGGGLVRMHLVHTDEHGFAHAAFDAAAASIAAGQTRDFQFYYRDPAGGGALANTSDGLSVTFCP